MPSRSQIVAVTATIIFHAALVAVAVKGLPDSREKPIPAEPVKIQLLQPPPAAPVAKTPETPPAAPIQSKKEPAEPLPRRVRTPAAEPREASTSQAKVQEALPETQASVSSPTAVAPAAPSASPQSHAGQVQAEGARPARTSASDASYASSNRKPPYPRRSLSNEEEGTVVLRVLVNADGTAGAVEVKNSSGFPLLDESARSTVQTWRFKPATIDGKPVAEWYQVSIPFTLQSN